MTMNTRIRTAALLALLLTPAILTAQGSGPFEVILPFTGGAPVTFTNYESVELAVELEEREGVQVFRVAPFETVDLPTLGAGVARVRADFETFIASATIAGLTVRPAELGQVFGAPATPRTGAAVANISLRPLIAYLSLFVPGDVNPVDYVQVTIAPRTSRVRMLTDDFSSVPAGAILRVIASDYFVATAAECSAADQCAAIEGGTAFGPQ